MNNLPKKKENETLPTPSNNIKKPEDNKKNKKKQSIKKKFKGVSANPDNKAPNLNENGNLLEGKNLQKNDNNINIDNGPTDAKKNKLSTKDSKNPLKECEEIPKCKNNEKLKIHFAESLTIFSKLKNSYKSKKGKIYIREFFECNKNDKNYNIIKSYNNNNIINNKNINMGKDQIEPNDEAKKFEVLKDNNINSSIYSKKPKICIDDKYYNKKEGFHNFGNTCYMNSFLQIIIHVPGLIELLMDYKNKIYKNSLLYYLLEIADNPSQDNLYNLRRTFMQKNSSYKYYQQEDSQEFGAELLKGINNELSDLEYFISGWKIEEGFNLKNIKSKDVKIKLDKLNDLLSNEGSDFQLQTVINYFLYYYETALIICDNKIVNFKYYGDVDNQLAFDMETSGVYSIDLIDMLKKKYLIGNNKLIKLPIVFNITLLRAVIDKPLIKTKVSIDLEIDLRDFLDKDFGDYSLDTKYTLYALNVCHASCKRYGHYYSYILINDEWYKFDDWRVSKADKNMIKEDSPYIYGIYYISKDYLNSMNPKKK